MARIAVGGFQHETNTFAPLKATWEMFEEVDGWPGFSRGSDLFPAIEGVHLPITGAVAVLRELGALEQLDQFIPPITISPLRMAEANARQPARRKRARATSDKGKGKSK